MTLPDYPPTPVQASKWAGVGLAIAPRRADCSSKRPSWFPFQINVCDCEDAPVPDPYAGRQLTLPAAPAEAPYPMDDPCA